MKKTKTKLVNTAPKELDGSFDVAVVTRLCHRVTALELAVERLMAQNNAGQKPQDVSAPPGEYRKVIDDSDSFDEFYSKILEEDRKPLIGFLTQVRDSVHGNHTGVIHKSEWPQFSVRVPSENRQVYLEDIIDLYTEWNVAYDRSHSVYVIYH